MGTSRLGLYNAALRWLEERKLASLTEAREPRRYLDDEFDENNLYCLSQGNWNFAMREIQVGPDTSVTPNFGFNFVFPKPADWNHTFQIASTESFDPLLRNYTDQNGFWFAYTPVLYVRYVSQDPNYGLNLALWTPAFTEYVAARLAWLLGPRIKQSEDKVEALRKLMVSARGEALSTDSQDLPPGKPPYGSWTLARAPRISYEMDDDDLPLAGYPIPGDQGG